jgi:hypothetical protein
MNELIESGFVEKYQSYRGNRKTTLYRIFDEFCLFHLQFMRSFKGNSWVHIYTKREYETWCGYAFEMICYKHVDCIKKELKCNQIQSKNYSWSNANAQVDLVIDRNDNLINLCEIKFSHDVFNLDEQHASKLRKKESEFKRSTSTRKGVHTIMLTTWGISGSHSIGLVSNSLTKACFFQ